MATFSTGSGGGGLQGWPLRGGAGAGAAPRWTRPVPAGSKGPTPGEQLRPSGKPVGLCEEVFREGHEAALPQGACAVGRSVRLGKEFIQL